MKSSEVKLKIVSLIANKIGVYRQGNIPAIWVGIVPFGQIASGLEVNIPSYPEFVTRGNQVVSERWSIRLAQFPSENGIDTIQDAITILQKNLIPHPAITFIDRPNPAENPLNNLPFLPSAVLRWELVEIW